VHWKGSNSSREMWKEIIHGTSQYLRIERWKQRRQPDDNILTSIPISKYS
jgi:hypothetical protein